MRGDIMDRKIIGVIIAYPESAYQQRFLDGIAEACALYGYDAAVFTTLVQSSHLYKDYLRGELNIYELMNFDRLDGVIVGTISLEENNDFYLVDKIGKKLKRECKKPVVCVDLPCEDYECIKTDDREGIAAVTSHILDHHGVNPDKVLFLTGTKGIDVTEERVAGIKGEYARRGLEFPDSRVFYGDYWYSGGRELAEKIVSGEAERPRAVIAASDHMAMGVIKALTENGIRVPEDILVTGYDSTSESLLHSPSVTSYTPDLSYAVHKAVNSLVSRIEPGRELIPPVHTKSGLIPCLSCGCDMDIEMFKSRLSGSLYKYNTDFSDPDIDQKTDLPMILNSYTLERYTAANGVESCYREIMDSCWLLRPYSNMWICLRPDWTDTSTKLEKGYPPGMDNVIHAVCEGHAPVGGDSHYSVVSRYMFDTSQMLPALDAEHEPSVFYFAPLHFEDDTLGYIALQCDIGQKHKIGQVFHFWVRNVNNAIELIRSKQRLRNAAMVDKMTGLYNRRGMDHALEVIKESAHDSGFMAIVIDMDGLKAINDTYGHECGDIAIDLLARCSKMITSASEYCIRAGGDEFYILGAGDYDERGLAERLEDLEFYLSQMSRKLNKPFAVTASAGYAMGSASEDLNSVIKTADARMYKEKTRKKVQRK